MSSQNVAIHIQLPQWLYEYQDSYQQSLVLEERMRFVIEASQRNINHQTGGPFAAGVFESDTGKLLALGVNLVSSQKLSILHAEVVALSLAQKQIDNYDLGQSTRKLELISSTEPCAMCLGAIPWSGIKRVITGATGQDAEAIGFDEGDKPANWQASLERRGISISKHICRDQAKAVLDNYSKTGGHIYNGGN